MKKIFLLSVIYLTCINFSIAQCIISSSEGYNVEVSVTPRSIIAPSDCPWGYNYNVEIDYSITFSGNNIPGSLYTLQGNLSCGSDNIYFNLPNSGGSGTITTTTNPYTNNTDCASATPASLNCSSVDIQIEGSGLANQMVACSNGSLPIDLVDFNVSLLKSQQVLIKWETRSETNNDYFSIERSVDLKEWEEVKRISGAGNSNKLLSYSATDNKLTNETVYYRLKQTDFDGTISYSDIKPLNVDALGKSAAIEIYPNPATNRLTIRGVEIKTLKLFNALGQGISETGFDLIDQNEFQSNIRLNELSSGLYFLKVNNEEMERVIIK